MTGCKRFSLPDGKTEDWESKLRTYTSQQGILGGSLLHFALWLLFQSKKRGLSGLYCRWLAQEEAAYV